MRLTGYAFGDLQRVLVNLGIKLCNQCQHAWIGIKALLQFVNGLLFFAAPALRRRFRRQHANFNNNCYRALQSFTQGLCDFRLLIIRIQSALFSVQYQHIGIGAGRCWYTIGQDIAADA